VKDYIKEAEKNCVRIAKHMDDMFKVVDALQTFGNRFFGNRFLGGRVDSGQDSFFRGLQLMRSALHSSYIEAISNCFTFAGVGGEEAAAYSKQKFVELFGDDTHAIMNLLDKYGNYPSWYTAADEKVFREQATQKIAEMKGEKDGMVENKGH